MQRVTLYASQIAAISRDYLEDDAAASKGTPDEIFLRVRPRDGTTVMLNIPADQIGARTATFTLTATSIPTAGMYRAWLHLTYADGTSLDTSEFELVALAHAPGEGIRTGRVYRLARLKVPVAWDALRGYKDYGDPGLMTLVQLIERRVMGAALTVEQEDGLDPLVANYLAHLCALAAIPPTIDYWTNQVVAQTARGADEIQSFPDRIRALEGQLIRMSKDTGALEAEAELVLGISLGKVDAPTLLDGGLPITPDMEWVAPFYGHRLDPRYATHMELL